jgi:hypothetical protein
MNKKRLSCKRSLRFEGFVTRPSSSGGLACRVTLESDRNRVFIAEGPPSPKPTIQDAAKAAVHAVSAYARQPMTLANCEKARLGGREVVVAIVNGREGETFTGAVMVKQDECTAAVLAVLDATNRWLEL